MQLYYICKTVRLECLFRIGRQPDRLSWIVFTAALVRFAIKALFVILCLFLLFVYGVLVFHNPGLLLVIIGSFSGAFIAVFVLSRSLS
ncbi:MAG TPA: hypothetical protein VE986_04970 [Hyphomicrobiales bacterium]|nr:hypothetical protein [Hyphomicrobiales bacterium]